MKIYTKPAINLIELRTDERLATCTVPMTRLKPAKFRRRGGFSGRSYGCFEPEDPPTPPPITSEPSDS